MAGKKSQKNACANPLTCKVPSYYHKKKGTLPDDPPQYLGTKESDALCTITAYHYNSKNINFQEFNNWENVKDWLSNSSEQLWINVCGLNATDTIQQMGHFFNIHPVVLEDLSNTYQRSKIESYEHYLFFATRVLTLKEDRQISNQPMFFILMDRVLLSFHELSPYRFKNIEKRLNNPESRLRNSRVDYLAYALIDEIIDEYYSITEWFSDELEKLDEEMLHGKPQQILETLSSMKNRLIALKRTIWPMRQLVHSMIVLDVSMIQETTQPYLRDIYDHSIQIVESLETFRELIASMMDIYLSQLNNRINEVMKVLTMIATVFMPLSFLTGIYGMNFAYMPELQMKFAYPAILVVFFLLIVSMLIYFKRKKWF